MQVNLSEKTIKETYKAIEKLLKRLPVNQKNKKQALDYLELLQTWEIFNDTIAEKTKTFKTFKDLKFVDKDMPFGYEGKHSELRFSNGYGISIITGYGAYTSQDKPYEIAVLKGDAICYDTPITSDVIGYNTKRDVTRIMKEIQDLPKVK